MAAPVRVRIAPSPTGFLHVGNVRTALFNWLFARHEGGEFLLRIENTDTGREVAEAAGQIQSSLRWLGLEWDGDVTFQLDRLERCQAEAQRLVEEGLAYVDDGAVRFGMPNEGVTAWEDLVLGPIEVKNETIEDLVILRSDGRPTYNFASPVEDWLDGITHVIRGQDHVPNTPKQVQILRALGAEPPLYGHVPFVHGADGAALSKRHGSVTTDEFRAQGYLPEALVNYLALLGWSYDDRTTIMSRDELVERFSLERVSKSAAVFDYEKLTWMNGVHVRALSEQEYGDALLAWLRDQGYDWNEELVRRTVPLVQEKIALLSEYPGYAGFLFGPAEPDAAQLDGSGELLQEAARAVAAVEPFTAEGIEGALRRLADERGLKPRDAFQPIRIAVTGSNVSPGLFESIELLGRDEAVRRLRSENE
jgi:glutamyl-tRNA synthetase